MMNLIGQLKLIKSFRLSELDEYANTIVAGSGSWEGKSSFCSELVYYAMLCALNHGEKKILHDEGDHLKLLEFVRGVIRREAAFVPGDESLVEHFSGRERRQYKLYCLRYLPRLAVQVYRKLFLGMVTDISYTKLEGLLPSERFELLVE